MFHSEYYGITSIYDEYFIVSFHLILTKSLIYSINRSKFDLQHAKQWLLDRKWTPQLTRQWQEYYNNAPRVSLLVREGHFVSEPLGLLPKYQDLEPALCIKRPIENATVIPKDNTNTIRCEKIFIFLSFLSIMIRKIFIQ
jgi:hypothetical protein